MSSVVAILSRSGSPDERIVRTMLQAAPHRGSDICVSIFGSCVLGVSNSKEMTEATISSPGALMAAFTGKLDNAVDVYSLAAERGFRPVSRQPADLLVSAFQAFGPEAPRYFRGPFAGLVTNGIDLWFFRDQIGFQALFYRDEPGACFVASEVKQIVAGTGIKKEPNTDVLERLFYARMTRETPSAIRGVERLSKTVIMHVSPTQPARGRQYWDPSAVLETARLSAGEVGEAFSEVFNKAISRVLTGRDAVALSGGIDSPAVAAYAAPLHRELTGRPMGAVSTVYPQFPRVDERKYIELIADYLKMDLHMFTPEAGPWDDILQWCALFDAPIHTLSFAEVSEFYRTARQFGFTTVFTGDVAEAVFDLNRLVMGHLLTHGRWRALWNRIRTMRARGGNWKTVGRALAVPFIPGRLINWYLHVRGRDFPQRIPEWIDARKVNEAPFRMDLLPPGRDRWAALQLRPFLEGASLTLESDDIVGSLWGVTIRRPFADVDVCEFFLSLPAELKYPDLKPKALMRGILRGRLPDAILDRRDKTTFDDYIMAKLDYDTLKRFLTRPSYRIPGVDYEALGRRIDRRDFQLRDYIWVNDLVRIHAFLSLWDC